MKMDDTKALPFGAPLPPVGTYFAEWSTGAMAFCVWRVKSSFGSVDFIFAWLTEPEAVAHANRLNGG